MLPLSEGPNKLGVSLPTPEAGKRFNFRNGAFYRYLEFWTMGEVHKSSDSEKTVGCKIFVTVPWKAHQNVP
jgi:hypothetical protein